MDFRRQRKETPPLSINAAVEERVDSFKFLGTIISSSLKWVDRTAIIKKAHQRLFPPPAKEVWGGLQGDAAVLPSHH